MKAFHQFYKRVSKNGYTLALILLCLASIAVVIFHLATLTRFPHVLIDEPWYSDVAWNWLNTGKNFDAMHTGGREFAIWPLPFLAGIALLPIKLALLEWYRKSELSADRAGLLASQDEQGSLRVFLKLAGGGNMGEMNLDQFLEQAREYEESGGPLDTIYKILNTLGASHPFNTLRAAELRRWVAVGHYSRIVGGEYPRRGEVRQERSYGDDVSDAASHYAREAREVAGDVVDAAKRGASAFAQAFKEQRPK